MNKQIEAHFARQFVVGDGQVISKDTRATVLICSGDQYRVQLTTGQCIWVPASYLHLCGENPLVNSP